MSALDAGRVTRTASAELWRNRNFQWLFATHVVCFIGNQFSLVAMPLLALKLTGSPAVLAATVALIAIPQVLLILLGGATADRYLPQSILTVTNCVSAVVLMALAITTVSGLLQIHLLLALTVVLGTSAAFAIPAASSILPRIVAPDLMARGNAALMMSWHIAALVGPVAAGSLIAWVSTAAPSAPSGRFAEAMGISCALALDAATFLIAACLLRCIRLPPSTHAVSNSVLRSIAEGLSWLCDDRPLRTLLMYYAAMMLLVTGPSQIGIRVLIDRHLGYGATGLGMLLTATSIGSIAGMGIAGFRPDRRIATLGTTILAVDILGGASLIALSHTHSIIMAALLCMLMGLSGGYVQIGVTTWIQKRIPLDMLGRAMSVITLVLLGVVPVSAAVTGVLLTKLTIVVILTACGSMLVVIALLCLSNATLRSIGPPPRLRNTTAES